jgi:predicted DNA-binding transcriptional regulator YafY
MRKLLQALPEPVRIEAKRAIDSVVADPTSWGNPNSVLIEPRRNEWIEPLQAAVIGCRTVELAYDTPRKGRSDRRINPLGLVVKQGVWYVLAVTDAGQRSFRVDRIVDVAVTDERFVRPDDFDLQQAWEAITTGYVERSSRVTIEAIATDYALPALRALGVETILHGEQPDGRWRVTLGAWNSDVLSAEISGVIGFLELIDPPDAVVSRLAEIGSELVSRFGTPPDR